MTVTATKIGRSPLTIDWSNLDRIPGVEGRVNADKEGFSASWNKLRAQFERREVAFYDAPVDNTLSQAEESIRMAQQILNKGIFTDVLFLGIGGSSLGPLSLLKALEEKRTNKLRFHFMENPDPTEWKMTVSGLEPAKTLVAVVAKSGVTFETIAQFLISLDWIGRDRMQSHVVAITDPAKGDLKAFVTEHGIPTLHIAPPMGGRFSVFSPVGLFACTLAGLSTENFLQGARDVRDYCEKTPVEKNPLMILGQHFIAHYPKRPIHVCMPYSTQLKTVGSWFVQLWGESLGKDGKGFTPLGALGATDQHSILQLLRDGPDDKITMFITVDQSRDPVAIPKTPAGLDVRKYPAFALLTGHSLQELLQTEYRATSLVLTRQNRPNLTLQLDSLDERAMGALYFAMAVLTAFTGVHWGVNPFDQPGVEEGKVYTRQALKEGSIPQGPEHDEHSPVNRLRRNQD